MLRIVLSALVSFAWAVSAASQTTELHLVEELRLGRFDGSGPDVFADIHDLAIDSSGRIYVLDPGWRDVRLFDRDGRFIRRIAPEGDGPGERRHRSQFPAQLTWDEGRGLLWIDDLMFLSVLDSLGVEHARDTRLPRGDLGPALPAVMATIVVAADRHGRIYEQQFRSVGDSTYSYVAGGAIAGDTLRAPGIPVKDVTELDISPEGWIWARRAGDDPESTWDVMDNCGVYVGSASVPHAISVTEVGSDGVIHVVASDELGIDYVVRLRLSTEISRRSCPR